MLRLDGDGRNVQVLIIESVGSMDTAGPKVRLSVILALLGLRIVLEVLIVRPILLIWLWIIPFLFSLSDFRLSLLQLGELNCFFLGKITYCVVNSPNRLGLNILTPRHSALLQFFQPLESILHQQLPRLHAFGLTEHGVDPSLEYLLIALWLFQLLDFLQVRKDDFLKLSLRLLLLLRLATILLFVAFATLTIFLPAVSWLRRWYLQFCAEIALPLHLKVMRHPLDLHMTTLPLKGSMLVLDDLLNIV